MTKYQWKDIAWRDLWLLPILVIAELVLGLIIGIVLLILKDTNQLQWLTSLDYFDIVDSIAGAASYILVILCFWVLHKREMPNRFRIGLQGIRQYWIWIIVVYVLTYISWQVYDYLTQFIPEQYQYETTQNEAMLDSLTQWNVLLPINLLFIVVIGPIVEEIIFRNILIGELGKKFNVYVMGVISAILFAGMHVTSAESPFEMIDYLLLAIPIVWLYIKSGCNLGVSIAFHILNNFISTLLDFI
ncbi:CPBP family intramembrane metalloprotease [Staphylococcus sp. IVB6246]|uniref:CPBP family intramembrane glutamic endopeptidase n=1 Tax=Staphylococcus sp. IVB6246 TaxID=2989772 RepID=UPI0021CFBE88|nr:CPBP family intramembrane glutamic endopeptidase [Staphylococcus sp. IVB6246]UXR69319.1 CPBP family intramembrane metalloprotease [Staphylococcus sp. IVB6246]